MHPQRLLVIMPSGPSLRSLWSPFTVEDIASAKEALRAREGILKKDLDANIGVWRREDTQDSSPPAVSEWARQFHLDAVVWTALRPRFHDREVAPTEEEAVEYLRRDLSHEARKQAERYIRMAPRQIDTNYRRRFESEFGWTPLS